jgi:hypothetical protein
MLHWLHSSVCCLVAAEKASLGLVVAVELEGDFVNSKWRALDDVPSSYFSVCSLQFCSKTLQVMMVWGELQALL